jgi:hypothetical protein
MLVENEKIRDDWRDTINDLCDDLDLDSNKSSVDKFVGGQELKEEYYFYNRKKGN